MDRHTLDALVTRVLNTMLARHRCQQLFLFGPAGDPFWCARTPLTNQDVNLLTAGLNLIEKTEDSRPKPFVGHDPLGRFAVAAIGGDSDLYFIVVNHVPDRAAAEATVPLIRGELAPELRPVRNRAERAAGQLP